MAKHDPLQAAARAEATNALSREVARLREAEQSLLEQNLELLEGLRLLEDSRDDFAELYDGAPVPLLTLGAQGAIRSANLAAAELFERERSWLVGRSFRMLFRSQDRAKVAACSGARGGDKDCLVELTLPDEVGVPVQLSTRFSERRAGVSHVCLLDLRARLEAQTAHRSDVRQVRARRRILLVEDHLETAEVMQEVLERNGYGVLSADCVEAAVDVDLARVDAIVSDIVLPDGMGTDLLRQLKRARDVPAIAFSGLTKSADVERAHQAGFDLYLTKPVDFPRLLAALGTMLAGAPKGACPHPS
jgi:CheY-like chemotaxis protein/PAS domain-containing protein